MNELDSLIEELILTRDFCGDEQQCIRDWEADNRKLSIQERMAAWRMFEILWEKYKRDAGVTKPIGHWERQRITKILNKS